MKISRNKNLVTSEEISKIFEPKTLEETDTQKKKKKKKRKKESNNELQKLDSPPKGKRRKLNKTSAGMKFSNGIK